MAKTIIVTQRMHVLFDLRPGHINTSSQNSGSIGNRLGFTCASNCFFIAKPYPAHLLTRLEKVVEFSLRLDSAIPHDDDVVSLAERRSTLAGS